MVGVWCWHATEMGWLQGGRFFANTFCQEFVAWAVGSAVEAGGGAALRASVCVCVLHIKPFFLHVDIQHNQCPCRFFNPINRRDTSSGVTKLRHRDTTLPRMQEALQWAMQCHVIMLDTTGTTYSIYEIEKRKETIKE